MQQPIQKKQQHNANKTQCTKKHNTAHTQLKQPNTIHTTLQTTQCKPITTHKNTLFKTEQYKQQYKHTMQTKKTQCKPHHTQTHN